MTITVKLMKKHLADYNRAVRKETLKGIHKKRKAEVTALFNEHFSFKNGKYILKPKYRTLPKLSKNVAKNQFPIVKQHIKMKKQKVKKIIKRAKAKEEKEDKPWRDYKKRLAAEKAKKAKKMVKRKVKFVRKKTKAGKAKKKY